MIQTLINGIGNESKIDIYALIADIETKTTKTGSLYVTLTLVDKEDQVKVNSFVAQDEKNINILRERYLNKVAKITVFRDEGGYLKATWFRLNPDAKITDFIPCAPIDAEEMYDSILQKLNGCGEIALIAIAIYRANKEKLLMWSAAKMMHHNMAGGLLYHVYRMMDLAENLCCVYPAVNRGLLLTGVALHDIGKLVELDTDMFGSAQYTSDGVLFGHPLLGVMMVRDAVAAAQYEEFYPPCYAANNREDIKLLEHMIASHHGEAEFGAISMPATPEAFLLHQIDMIDSHYFVYEKEMNRIEPGMFSDKKVFGIGCKVYHPVASTIQTTDETREGDD